MVHGYQITGFHFDVVFKDLENASNVDVQFQSISGLSVDYEMETIKEGGENWFEHVIPTRTKYPDLILKRGIIRPKDSGLTVWCQKAFDNMEFKPINLDVRLLNQEHQPLLLWKVFHAYPKSWKFSDLSAEKGEILIETMELNYNFFRMDEPGGKRMSKDPVR